MKTKAFPTEPFVNRFIQTLATGARREKTRRAYARAVEYFRAWARYRSVTANFPIEETALLLFIADHLDEQANPARAHLAGIGLRKSARPCAVNTLRYFLKCFSQEHSRHGLASNCSSVRVRQVLRDARRYRPFQHRQRSRRAISLALVNEMLASCDNSLRGRRDRALIAVAYFTGGRRRGEVAELHWEDLERGTLDLVGAGTLTGYWWHLFRHKVDRVDREASLPLFHPRAVAALEEWRAALRACAEDRGPVFRRVDRHGRIGGALSSNAVNVHVVQRRLRELKVDTGQYSAHSLRSGWLVQAGLEGLPIQEAMRLSLHRDVQTAKRYHDQGNKVLHHGLHVGLAGPALKSGD